eukprot:TRINITY_DN10007_c0_g3_i1.p1 TRINITY_DN10007_c0_g3~~TRINITY_DN10007_c0_g3_i1.p1  ORF type:complete len:4448 (+),score=1759.39 TRINITY_DN10007_c0_g3_i1:82-13425(+)
MPVPPPKRERRYSDGAPRRGSAQGRAGNAAAWRSPERIASAAQQRPAQHHFRPHISGDDDAAAPLQPQRPLHAAPPRGRPQQQQQKQQQKQQQQQQQAQFVPIPPPAAAQPALPPHPPPQPEGGRPLPPAPAELAARVRRDKLRPAALQPRLYSAAARKGQADNACASRKAQTPQPCVDGETHGFGSLSEVPMTTDLSKLLGAAAQRSGATAAAVAEAARRRRGATHAELRERLTGRGPAEANAAPQRPPSRMPQHGVAAAAAAAEAHSPDGSPQQSPAVSPAASPMRPGGLSAVRERLQELARVTDGRVAIDDCDDSSSVFQFIVNVDPYDTLRQQGGDFIYANLAKRRYGEPVDPYSLVVVPRIRANSSAHVTVSAVGVTHHFKGSASFTPLEQFVSEYCCSKQLQTIPFFRKFRRWKIFQFWRRYLRGVAVERARESLLENHLMLQQGLADSVFAIRGICQDIERLPFLALLEDTATLSDFSAAQRAQRELCAERLNGHIGSVAAIVSAACRATLRPKQNARLGGAVAVRRTGDVDDDFAAFAAQTVAKELSDAPPLSGSALLRPSHTEQSHRRARCRKLVGFMRLVDIMIADSLVDLAVRVAETVQELLHWPRFGEDQIGHLVEAMVNSGLAEDRIAAQWRRRQGTTFTEEPTRQATPDDRAPVTAADLAAAAARSAEALARQLATQRGPMVAGVPAAALNAVSEPGVMIASVPLPLWSCEVVLDHSTGKLAVHPHRDDFRQAVDDITKGVAAAVSGVSSLLSMQEFRSYVIESQREEQGEGAAEQPVSSPAAEPTRPVALTLSQHQRHAALCDSIYASLRVAFQEVDLYAETFEPFRRMYEETLAVDGGRIRAEDPPADWFRDTLDSFKDQARRIGDMPTEGEVAMLRVDTAGLRGALLPAPQRCIDVLRHVLPVIAAEKTNALLRDLQDAVHRLTAPPNSVEDFADFIRFHDKCYQSQEAYEQRFEVAQELRLLIDLEGIPLGEEDHESWDKGAVPLMRSLRMCIHGAEEIREAQTKHFAGILDERMQGLEQELSDIARRAADQRVSDEDADMEEVIAFVQGLAAEVAAVHEQEQKLCGFQELFGLDVTGVERVSEVAKDVNDKAKLWTAMRDWAVLTASWLEMPFAQVDPEMVSDAVGRFTRTVNQVTRAFPLNPVVLKLRMMVDEFRIALPVIACLRNPHLQPHHLQQIDSIIGQPISSRARCTLGELLGYRVTDLKEEIQAVSTAASQEAALEKQLMKVIQTWAGVEFALSSYKDYKDCWVLASVDDVLVMLEDTSVMVSTVVTSRHCVGALRARAEKWGDDLRLIGVTLDKWLECQRNWMYLENIFGQAEIQKQWQADAKVFARVDRSFRERMRAVALSPFVYHCIAGDPDVLGQLDKANREMEKVLSNLERNLDEKRQLFPRFYFLSNEDLLDLLSQVKTPERVVPHMLKLFDNVKKLHFDDVNVFALESMEGEVVQLQKPVRARGDVEKWLERIDEEMQRALRRAARDCVADRYSGKTREEWLLAAHPTQLLLICNSLVWCNQMELGLAHAGKDHLGPMYKHCCSSLEKLACLTDTDLGAVQRALLRAVITLEVHERNLVADMQREGVNTMSDFGWQKQLRSYWAEVSETEKDLQLRQLSTTFGYSYEYEGAQGRLVITPLTDRIYMTITGALHLCLGASPSGPAGTGKTETVKDMAKTLARRCIVYNCSDGVTYRMMEKFFSGLCQSGSWCCLDEFNRVNVEVLSVIAQQLAEVREALLARQKRFNFQGSQISLKDTYGVFVTMNPTYAGRTELPDNLKALFRPVSVMVPDFAMISEVVLYAEGFKSAQVLSNKITQLYKLSSEQLSPQDHYDFGMRALKSVLVVAGDLRRADYDESDEDELEDEGEDEDEADRRWEERVLIRACANANLPKFVAEDIPLFQGILHDLFPGVKVTKRLPGEVLFAVEQRLSMEGLQPEPDYTVKIIQFHETLAVRHGVMLIGETGCGKTVCRCTLADAYCTLAMSEDEVQNTTQRVINPKSITYGELYGKMDPLSAEWTDGVLVVIVKHLVQAADDGDPDWTWVVFDGPVDTLWVESMNSVLDDSKLLCLDNGYRIKLPPTVHMVFEVGDLTAASPATVSRCGMVYMNFADLGWEPILRSWVESKLLPMMSPEIAAHTAELFRAHLPKVLRFARQECSMYIAVPDCGLVRSMCDMFYMLAVSEDVRFDSGVQLRRASQRRPSLTSHRSSVDAQAEYVSDAHKEQANLLFAFALIWGVGGTLDDATQDRFDAFARDALGGIVMFGGSGTVFEFLGDFTSRRMVRWDDRVPAWEYDPSQSFFDIIVPTVDTARFSYLIQMHLSSRRALLLSGRSGVGKSALLGATLRRGTHSGFVIDMQFSAKTTASRTQEALEAKLKTRKGDQLCAPGGKSITVFVDDVNMPAPEVSGAIPPLELLRQVMSHGGVYDRTKFFWKGVKDLTVVASCAPSDGGRSPLPPRLVRLFSTLCVPDVPEDSMQKIARSILLGFLQRGSFNREVLELGKGMANAAVDVYVRTRSEFRPRPATAHYTFNMRDLSKLVQGMMQVHPRSMQTERAAALLFIHEAHRCFCDRLVDDEDRARFSDEILVEALARHFPNTAWKKDDLHSEWPILWGDFSHPDVQTEDRLYEHIRDPRKLPDLFQYYLDEYAGMDAANFMGLVFFKDCCVQLCRILRILRQSRGSALLVGLSGSGRLSLTRLGCIISECECFRVEVSEGYNLASFRADLLQIYDAAGLKKRPVALVLSDTQLGAVDGMLEDVNTMLNSGEVPGLFPADEREKRINACLEQGVGAAAEQGDVREALWAQFLRAVRDHLHVVLCMSPVGDSFRARCRQYPSLVSCCTIDWFDRWPPEALKQVSTRLLSEVDWAGHEEQHEFRHVLPELCTQVHAEVIDSAARYWSECRRRFYVTPSSYIEFVSLFREVFEERRTTLNRSLKKIVGGQGKVHDTNCEVLRMEDDLTNMAPKLQRARDRTDELMVELGERRDKATEVRTEVSGKEEEAAERQREAQEIQQEATKDLEEAMPELRSAIKALGALSKGDIVEVRGYAVPPKAVATTCEAVLILLKEKKAADWGSARAVLSRTDFLDRLQGYDRDRIPQDVISRLEQRVMKDADFTPDKVGVQSGACRSLCMWVRAIYNYYYVEKKVTPKREKLRQAQQVLDIANAQLFEARSELQAVQEELSSLQGVLDLAMAEKRDLENTIEVSEKRLKNADLLRVALRDQVLRWEEVEVELRASITDCPESSFMASAALAYYGAFTTTYRGALAARWGELIEVAAPAAEGEAGARARRLRAGVLQRVLSSELQVREWIVASLPSDSASVENAVLVQQCCSEKSTRWPLMIDPQGQALRWVTRMESKQGLRILQMPPASAGSDVVKRFCQTVEQAVTVGAPLMIADLGETLDPYLDPLLGKRFFESPPASGEYCICMGGERTVHYEKSFRLYMTTKLSNPHFLPEVCIKTSVVNFTVTMDGLEEQLLSDVVSIERHELEEQKRAGIQSIALNRKQLATYEDQALEQLEKEEGNILDNSMVIESLRKLKQLSEFVERQIRDTEEKSVAIIRSCEQYRSVAARAATTYFVVADLALIDPMYQYSLEYFKRIFVSVIQFAPQHDTFDEHLDYLRTACSRQVYNDIARGLLNVHRPTFAFLLASAVRRGEGFVPHSEWQFLCRGSAFAREDTVEPNPAPVSRGGWIEARVWSALDALETYGGGAFSGLCGDVAQYEAQWRAWARSPFAGAPPDSGSNRWSLCSPFRRLLLTRCFRDELTQLASEQYVDAEFPGIFPSTVPLDLDRASTDATGVGNAGASPILFLLSPGADPGALLRRYAAASGMADRLHAVSLGQGQEAAARGYIERGRKHGDWVLLQNCHLAKSFMPELEQLVAALMHQGPSAHCSPVFRLWLTSMPIDSFPIPILQSAVKLACEPPAGIRANLQRMYSAVTTLALPGMSQREEGDEVATDPSSELRPFREQDYRSLHFCLCFFHAVLLERKQYGPLGWNMQYQFNETDLEVSLRWLQLLLAALPRGAPVPWGSLRCIVGEINYGGRVTDPWDRRLLECVLRRFFRPAVLLEGATLCTRGGYRVPPSWSGVDGHRDTIDGLPTNDMPEAVGLHSCAEHQRHRTATENLLAAILAAQPRLPSGGDAQTLSPEEEALGRTAEILGVLPEPLQLHEAGPHTFRTLPNGLPDSLGTVLRHELVKFNALLSRMRHTLEDFGRAMKGLAVLSEQLDRMFTAVLNDAVPELWRSIAYESVKPLGSWVRDLGLRVGFMRRWLRRGQPESFWISAFYFPHGFMTGILQSHARQVALPVDELAFAFSVLLQGHNADVPPPPPLAGVYIHGVFAEACRWDTGLGRIVDMRAQEPPQRLPLIHFCPKAGYRQPPGTYSAPLYKTSRRAGVLTSLGHSSNFIVAVDLPCGDSDEDHWVQCGAALLTQLDD